MTFTHIPVLYHEIMDIMAARPGEVFVDCTLGGGGHSAGFLQSLGPSGRLIGIDQDPAALAAAEARLSSDYANVTYVHSNYRHLADILTTYAPGGVDGILFDLGVSSHQIDAAERGFSYMQDAPLDMRMNPEEPLNAREVVNTYSEKALYQIIKDYGEENWAKRVAAFIVQERRFQPIETTLELVEVIKKAIPKDAREPGSHVAKRTFQAIRIEVNRELDVLTETILVAAGALRPGGRLGIISFHSLEDRIVKDAFRLLAAKCICPPKMPICNCGKVQEATILTRKPVMATGEEAAQNPRAKSAKFRAIKKL